MAAQVGVATAVSMLHMTNLNVAEFGSTFPDDNGGGTMSARLIHELRWHLPSSGQGREAFRTSSLKTPSSGGCGWLALRFQMITRPSLVRSASLHSVTGQHMKPCRRHVLLSRSGSDWHFDSYTMSMHVSALSSPGVTKYGLCAALRRMRTITLPFSCRHMSTSRCRHGITWVKAGLLRSSANEHTAWLISMSSTMTSRGNSTSRWCGHDGR